jgi:hypothetical protein
LAVAKREYRWYNGENELMFGHSNKTIKCVITQCKYLIVEEKKCYTKHSCFGILSGGNAKWLCKTEFGRRIMEYKNEILKMINNINNETLLERIYVFVKRFIKNWGD